MTCRLCLIAILGTLLSPFIAIGAEPGQVSVLDYGAVADGATDNTAAFQQALDAAGVTGGVVSVPAGQYHFSGTLEIPRSVTLEGVWRAPERGSTPDQGSVLWVTHGKGQADGAPFIRLNTSSVLKGLTIYYPDQIKKNPPTPYPWTVQSQPWSDNCTILDLTMINPYQAVDFGTHPTGRHLIRGLYGYPLYRGLFVDQCYDVGRLEDIHFWPFWDTEVESELWDFTAENSIAFIFGKSSGQMAVNLFSIFYKIGIQFVDNGHGSTSGTFTNIRMDESPCALQVDAAVDNSGLSIVNSGFNSAIRVTSTNKGLVKFTACGFWASEDSALPMSTYAELAGSGTVIFNACHFAANWDRQGAGTAAIEANNSNLIVNGCDFQAPPNGQPKIRLGAQAVSAVITGNRMAGGVTIEGLELPRSGETDFQIGLNSGL